MKTDRSFPTLFNQEEMYVDRPLLGLVVCSTSCNMTICYEK